MCSSKTPEVNVINNNDVLIEILLRLPLKTLMGCKCVCKWWNNLISDPMFKSSYSQRNPHYHISGFFLQKFLFLELYSKLLFFPCEGHIDAAPNPSLCFIEDEKGVCIQHSCNGLLVCSSFRCPDKDRKYYICEPTTKRYLPLPNPECRVFGINIAYDPNKSAHYKIVCISDSYLSINHRQIKVFSPVTGSWKASGKQFIVSNEDMLFNRGVFWNGALHWIGRGHLGFRFDIERERMLKMPMPRIPEGWTKRKPEYFGESGGHLFLVEIYDPFSAGFDVMEMKADYSGWFVKYHVNLDIVARRRNKFSILHITHQNVGEEDKSFMVVHVPGKFVTFKLRDNILMEVQANNEVDEGLGLWYSWEGVFPYSNTCCYF